MDELLYRGQKIQAIKLVREASALDLKGAKDAVEQGEADLRQHAPTKFKYPAGKGGCAGMVLLCAGGRGSAGIGRVPLDNLIAYLRSSA